MARLPVPGSDDGTWGDILNDFLSQSHHPDGTLQDTAIPDGSVTPIKLSQSYLPASLKGAPNGIATLDASGTVPASQLPPAGSTPDATATSTGVIQLAGDLGGTATTPTVPALANKYVKPAGGIPEADLDSAVQTKLSSSATDATVVHLAGAETITGAKDFTGGITVNGTNVVVGTDMRLTDQRVPTDNSVTDAKVSATASIAQSKIAGLTADLASKASTTHAHTITDTTGLQATLDAKVDDSEKGSANGVATLDATGKVPSSQLPAGAAPADATTSAKGVIQLAGDLAGTAAAPTVPGLGGKASAGANSDITSLSGLTTALSIGQGGTGSSTRQGAINALTDASGATTNQVLTRDASGNAVFAPVPVTAPSGSGVTFPSLDYTTTSIAAGTAASFNIPWPSASAAVLIRHIRFEPSDPSAVFDLKILRQNDYTPAGLTANLAFYATQIKGKFMREFLWDYEDEDVTSQLHVWINNTGSYATTVRILLNNRVIQ